jgi:hypothetical protein
MKPGFKHKQFSSGACVLIDYTMFPLAKWSTIVYQLFWQSTYIFVKLKIFLTIFSWNIGEWYVCHLLERKI